MRFFVFTALIVGALVASLLEVVHHRHRQVSLGYEIGRATVAQRDLNEELEKLLIDRAALVDPSGIEPVARRWGFRTPGPEQVVVVPPAKLASLGGAHSP